MLITDKELLKHYTAEKRIWQGIPGIEVTKNGRIFVCFYSGGTKETLGNYCMLVKNDDGMNFSEPIAVTYFGEEHRCFDPCLWIDPLGRLWFTWSVQPDNGLYAVVCDNPDAGELVWGPEKFIGHDVMMNKPTVLSTGEWLFPVTVWSFEGCDKFLGYRAYEKPGAFVYKTSDNGETFLRLGGALVPDRAFEEHMVVELQDGRLMMLVRTFHGIGVAYSVDRGRTWTARQDSGIPGPSSRFHLRRLKSGRLLLVNHKNFTGRNNLTAMLSEDDGKTWSAGLLLDERSDVSYPDVTEAEDGFLYIAYDRERGGFQESLDKAQACAREILYAKVTEADILAERLVTPGSGLKKTVNKLTAYLGDDPNPYALPELDPPEVLAARLLEQYDAEEILQRLFEACPMDCVTYHTRDFTQIDRKIDALRDSGWSSHPLLTELVVLVRAMAGHAEQHPAVERMIRWIGEHLTEELSLEEMARACGISRYYMCHLFKTHTGATIIQYRNELRLTEAKKRLIASGEKISDIATACGFASVSYFTEVFTKAENVIPTAYRKLHT